MQRVCRIDIVPSHVKIFCEKIKNGNITNEDIETVALKFGFEKIKNLGTDFMVTRKIVDDMSDEKFEIMKPLYDYMTSYESCTGMSNHASLICKNNK